MNTELNDLLETEAEASKDTLKELSELCKLLNESKEQEDAAKEIYKEKATKVEELGRKIMAYLLEYNMTKFDSPFGAVSVVKRMRVKNPKEADLLTFFDYIKQRGDYEKLATVNNNSLNSWYNAIIEERELSDDFSRDIPGLALPEETPYIKFKGK